MKNGSGFWCLNKITISERAGRKVICDFVHVWMTSGHGIFNPSRDLWRVAVTSDARQITPEWAPLLKMRFEYEGVSSDALLWGFEYCELLMRHLLNRRNNLRDNTNRCVTGRNGWATLRWLSLSISCTVCRLTDHRSYQLWFPRSAHRKRQLR